MIKKAEHRVDVCDKCKGEGKIIGPKQVELTEEDETFWHKGSKLENLFFYSAIVLTPGSFGLFMFYPMICLWLGYPFPNPGILFAIVVILCAIGFFLALEAGSLEEKRRGKILARYGVEKGEAYEITNLDKK